METGTLLLGVLSPEFPQRKCSVYTHSEWINKQNMQASKLVEKSLAFHLISSYKYGGDMVTSVLVHLWIKKSKPEESHQGEI